MREEDQYYATFELNRTGSFVEGFERRLQHVWDERWLAFFALKRRRHGSERFPFRSR